MNTMRVFLHNLLWEQDPKGFKKRIDDFLAIAARHHIRPVFVLFDSCWDPYPKLGPQHPPIPGVHNSGWVQAPGADVLADPSQYPQTRAYVKGVVGAFANDPRILAWDLWNEPDNGNDSSYAKGDPKNKNDVDRRLFAAGLCMGPLRASHAAAHQRRVARRLVLTRQNDPRRTNSDRAIRRHQLPQLRLARRLRSARQAAPAISSPHHLHRIHGAQHRQHLRHRFCPSPSSTHVGAINWGLVAGKSQTWIPWDSWQHPYVSDQPAVWQHDVFHPDGTPLPRSAKSKSSAADQREIVDTCGHPDLRDVNHRLAESNYATIVGPVRIYGSTIVLVCSDNRGRANCMGAAS